MTSLQNFSNATSLKNDSEITQGHYEGYILPLEIFSAIIMFLTIIFGFPGNILTLVTFAKTKSIQTHFNVMVVTLTCYDILIQVFCLPIATASIIYPAVLQGPLCGLVDFSGLVSFIFSALLIPTLGFMRLYAAKQKTIYKFSKKAIITVLTTYSFAAILPTIIMMVLYPDCAERGRQLLLKLNWVVLFISSLGFLLIGTCHLVLHRHIIRTMATLKISSSSQNQENKYIVSITAGWVILLFFGICLVGCNLSFALFLELGPTDWSTMKSEQANSIGHTTYVFGIGLAGMQSAFNSYAYVATSQVYRRAVKTLLTSPQRN
jgi:hypothetical protein